MLWLWNWSLVCLSVLLGGVRAGTLNIQDNNPGMMYSGSWYPDASPNAYGKHETWTNSSGASVYYDFQGTEVQVFATMRPTGTYLTNVSFQIDGAAPAFWVTTANVPQETFNKLVYTSPGTLAADGTHRITITNYGSVFWLVYLQITTPDVSGGSSVTTSATTTTTTTAVSTATGTATASTTTTTTGTGTPTSSAGTTSAGTSGSNTGPSSASTASSSSNKGTSSAGGASATSGTTTSGSASRTPVIIGAAVGSVGGAALLLAALCFWCMYSRSRRRALAPTPFDGEANPAPHLVKDRPPAHPPSRFQRWMAGSQPAATEPGYGYPSTDAPENTQHERAHSEPVDSEALKQLAAFRAAAEARAAPREPLERPPPAVSIPSVLETPHPSTIPSTSGSPRSAAPMSRSGALARAFSFSSPLSRDPARARFPPSDAPTAASTALASSGVLPPPSPYVRQVPASTRPVFFRVLRRSRDGGVRLAGGALGERGAATEAPEEYDRQILDAMSEGGSTLPPEYQQYPAGDGGGDAGEDGRAAGR